MQVNSDTDISVISNLYIYIYNVYRSVINECDESVVRVRVKNHGLHEYSMQEYKSTRI